MTSKKASTSKTVSPKRIEEGTHGDADSDWLQAEEELTIASSNGKYPCF